jgi:hypothetical protein
MKQLLCGHSAENEEKLTKIALVVDVQGNTERVEFDNDNSLATFQKAVGGLIQPVNLGKEVNGLELEMYVNEEGIMLELPTNPIATAFATEVYQNALPAGQPYYLLGTAVFVGGLGEDGYSTGLDIEQIKDLESIAQMAKILIKASQPF